MPSIGCRNTHILTPCWCTPTKLCCRPVDHSFEETRWESFEADMLVGSLTPIAPQFLTHSEKFIAQEFGKGSLSFHRGSIGVLDFTCSLGVVFYNKYLPIRFRLAELRVVR